jgi:hypothetical protein
MCGKMPGKYREIPEKAAPYSRKFPEIDESFSWLGAARVTIIAGCIFFEILPKVSSE